MSCGHKSEAGLWRAWVDGGVLEEIKGFLKKYRCYGTVCFVLVNVAWFLVTYVTGATDSVEGLLACGAMRSDALLRGEYPALFTAFFVHFDAEHLLNNMLLLLALGALLEQHTGTRSFVAIYLLSGLGGNVATAVWYLAFHKAIAVSAGASGAVFGVVGGFLGALIWNRGRLEDMTTRKFMVFVLLSLYQGFASQGVNNVAHVAGFLCGFVASVLSELIRRENRMR